MSNSDDQPERATPTSRVLTATALAEINAQFAQALTDLTTMIDTALAHALNPGRRAQCARILAAQVPALEQTERSLLVSNARLADVPGHQDQATFVTRRTTWLEHLSPAQRAIYDASRHGASQVNATLLRYGTARATPKAPSPRPTA